MLFAFFAYLIVKEVLILEFENNVGKVVVVNNMIYVSTMVYRYEMEVFDPIYIWVFYLKVVDELKRMEASINTWKNSGGWRECRNTSFSSYYFFKKRTKTLDIIGFKLFIMTVALFWKWGGAYVCTIGLWRKPFARCEYNRHFVSNSTCLHI